MDMTIIILSSIPLEVVLCMDGLPIVDSTKGILRSRPVFVLGDETKYIFCVTMVEIE
jgi:hypothetical protein